jgi:hypothetical protein
LLSRVFNNRGLLDNWPSIRKKKQSLVLYLTFYEGCEKRKIAEFGFVFGVYREVAKRKIAEFSFVLWSKKGYGRAFPVLCMVGFLNCRAIIAESYLQARCDKTQIHRAVGAGCSQPPAQET